MSEERAITTLRSGGLHFRSLMSGATISTGRNSLKVAKSFSESGISSSPSTAGQTATETPKDEWCTPDSIVDLYGPFDLDAAATEENTKANIYITKEENALTCDWGAKVGYELLWDSTFPLRVWCNPPYGKEAGPLMKWVETFYRWQEAGFEIVALLPADTSTRWFHALYDQFRYGPQSHMISIDFLEHRIRFIDPATGKQGGSPKFGSIIVRFRSGR